jgi:phosphoglycolate phosphatase-like HAD superfamily hydrolase
MTTGMDAEPLLVLWDVDGTLIDNGGVSKLAYARGFEALTGRAPSEPVITDGRTDPAIFRSLLTRHGITVTDELLARVPEVMSEALTSLVPQLRERGRAMPGALDAIAALAMERGVIQSLLTGNIAPNGHTKVATFGIGAGLDVEVGGYGSDHEERSELVAAALHKTQMRYGLVIPPARVVLIGDTPRDVEAARRSGSYAIGVATGRFDTVRLLDEGADRVLTDLRDTDALVAAVRAARPRPAAPRRSPGL